MSGSVCAVVLAAGAGLRLRPLTAAVPKALCPVGNVALLDRALARLAAHGLAGPGLVAVNACYLADQIVEHVGARAQLSVERGEPLGTAGGVANLRDWIAGRAVLVGNADAFLAPAADLAGGDQHPTVAGGDLRPLLDGWDGEQVRVLTVAAEPGGRVEFVEARAKGLADRRRPGDPQAWRFAGFSLLPWSRVADLPVRPTELVRAVWRPAEADGRLVLVPYRGTYIDCGTPADYLRANRHAAGDGSLVAVDAHVTGPIEQAVIGARAQVAGRVTRGVVWPDGEVGAGEHLIDAVRVGRALTVPAQA
ncbi:MAG: nucleotidyltransferase family protein [Micromonosporaceae bacterium]